MAPLSAHSGERLLLTTDEHWVRYLRPVFMYILLTCMSVLLFLLAGYTAHHQEWMTDISFIAALALFLLAHHWLFLFLFSESMAGIVITDKRLIHFRDKLFVEQGILEISFERTKWVVAEKHGILQTLLNYGTLNFENRSFIHFVAHPNTVVKEIQQAMGRR